MQPTALADLNIEHAYKSHYMFDYTHNLSWLEFRNKEEGLLIALGIRKTTEEHSASQSLLVYIFSLFLVT